MRPMSPRERLIEAGSDGLFPLNAPESAWTGSPFTRFRARVAVRAVLDALPAAVAVRFFAARLSNEEWAAMIREAMLSHMRDRGIDPHGFGVAQALMPDEYRWMRAAMRAALVPEGPEGDER